MFAAVWIAAIEAWTASSAFRSLTSELNHSAIVALGAVAESPCQREGNNRSMLARPLRVRASWCSQFDGRPGYADQRINGALSEASVNFLGGYKISP
jgi:hypothetical protein